MTTNHDSKLQQFAKRAEGIDRRLVEIALDKRGLAIAASEGDPASTQQIEKLDAESIALARETQLLIDAIQQVKILQDQEAEAALEQKNFASVGVLKGGATYNANSFVTDRGSIWFCRQTTKERPGDGNTSWVLACKGGRDGREATALPR